MKLERKFVIALNLLMAAVLLLAACQQATPTPERVVETVVVTEMVEGEPVERVVTATPAPEMEESAEPVAFLEADGMEECLPMPELPEPTPEAAAAHSARAASLAPAAQSRPSEAQAVESYYGSLQAAPVQQSDQIYRVGVFEDITSLNFWGANGPDNTVWNSYMLPPRLSMYSRSDKYFDFVPNAAAVDRPEPLRQEGEFWVTEVPIREDITWSDGTPFTANDVAFTANTVMALNLISGNWGQWYDSNFLDHLEVVDDYTVKYFYHTKPGIARHEQGVLQAPILAAHYWEPIVAEAMAPIEALGENPAEEDLAAAQAEAQDLLFAHQPDGEPLAGAFIVNRWEPGAFVDNSTYADYFLSGLTVRQYANGAYEDSNGLVIGTPEGEPETTIEVGPHVAGVVYNVYGSQDAAILALQAGEVDFILNSLGLQRGLADQVRGDPNLSVIENPTNGFRYLSFNVRRRPMNDCSFRQAVAVLIDKEFVTVTILQNVAFPLYSYVAPGNVNWYYDEAPKLGQGLSREQRMNLAIAILEQAGYSWENDQKPTFEDESVTPGGRLLMPDGTPVPTLNLWAPSPSYDPLRSTFAVWIESWLNEVGIPTKANLAGFNVLIPRIFTEQDFDMYILGWSLSIFPSGLRDFFSEEQAAPDGNNAGGFVTQEFEDLSLQLLTCESEEACRPISEQIQEYLAIQTPYVVLFDTGIIEAYRSDTLEYPYTEQLYGLQFTHQQPGTLQSAVKVK